MDVGLTAIGLQHGFVEVNPIARAGIAVAGTWALIGGKGVALGVGAVCARSLDRQRYLVPVVFIVVWGVAAVANARLILLSL